MLQDQQAVGSQPARGESVRPYDADGSRAQASNARAPGEAPPEDTGPRDRAGESAPASAGETDPAQESDGTADKKPNILRRHP